MQRVRLYPLKFEESLLRAKKLRGGSVLRGFPGKLVLWDPNSESPGFVSWTHEADDDNERRAEVPG